MEKPLNPDGRRLRVGLLLDSFAQPRWVCRVVEEIRASEFAEVVLVVKNAAAGKAARSRRSTLRRLKENRNHLLYSLYTKLDDRLMKTEPDAFAVCDLAPLVEGCPVLEVEPLMTKFTDTLRDEDVEAVTKYDLDVALRFGFRIIKGRALTVARHGVWSYHHGDALVSRGSPPGFWEVLTDEPVTGSVLQVLTEELDNGRVLYRSWSPTTNRFSVRKNNNNYYWKSAAFIMRKLKELHDEGELRIERDRHHVAYTPYSRRLYRKPTNGEMLPLLGGLAARGVRRAAEKALTFEQWALCYRFRAGESDTNNTFYKFKRLVPPRDRFWADPFPACSNGRYYIFFEELIFATNKAHISAVEVGRETGAREPFKVLERPYHLSYPFLFEWRGGQYMIPESGANGTVELYRSTDFPAGWQLERVLLEDLNNPVDATLHEEDGRWWMFLSIQVEGASANWDELHLYYADSPLGPWMPHRRNPVKSDVRGSRPAGKLFRWGDELYRPAQDCSRRYGYAISLNRVVRLSTEEYEEEEVSKILPEWDRRIIGTHTLNSVGDLTVVDCLLRRGNLRG